MFVHVVKPGETLFSIAELYGGTAEHLRAANDLEGDRLVPGMSLVIPAGPRCTLQPYRIREGDMLERIAKRFSVPPSILKASNERMDERNLAAGETIWVPCPIRRERSVEVNAFMVPTGGDSDEAMLADAAGCLTYVSVFHARVHSDGTLSDLPEGNVIAKAKAEKIAPLLTVTNFDGTRFNADLARTVFHNPDLRKKTVHNLFSLFEAKGYSGINVDFEHLYPDDREPFNAFVRELTETAGPRGIPVAVSLGPKTSDDPRHPFMGAYDYRTLGALADRAILMTFEWGWAGGPPMAVAPLHMLRRVLQYATAAIPAEKILMGMALYGYDWPVPYEKGRTAAGISPKAAVELAIRAKGHIHFHAASAAPMFTYRGPRQETRQVWFEDARSVLAKFHLVREMGLAGVSYWMLGHPFPQNWTLLSGTFDIRKSNMSR